MISRHALSGGFTVIEMLTVVALIAISLAFAIPSMAGLIRSNRVQGEIEQLGASIRYARSQALRQGETVIVCASTQGQSCDGGNRWETGWMVFADANRNGSPDSGEVLKVEQAFTGTDVLSASDNGSRLKFNRDGFSFDLPTSGKMIFKLVTTPADAMAQRCLAIHMAGQFSILKAGQADCT